MHVLHTPSGKGQYVAKIADTGGKYHVIREWVKGRNQKTPDGSSLNRREYTVSEPGLYEVQRWTSNKGKWREYFIYTDSDEVVSLGADKETLKTYAYLYLNSPGWFSDRCECGEPVARYDGDGFPYCEQHEDQVIA